MASKGKGISSGGSSGGKRKYGDDDDKSGGGRKRSNPSGVLRFFEDAAADDGDESDFDDFMEEEFETQPIVQNEPGKAHNLPFIPKEEDLDGDEFEKMMEERYRRGSPNVTYAEDNYENKRSIDGSVPLPTLKDPIMWKVKCMVGRERYSAFCMMQKFVDLRSLGTRLQIISAFAVEHIKGFVFIEADKQSDINEACKGICSIYSSRVMPVPNTEVSHLLSPRTRKNEITVGMWARVKNGNYKGDLARVVFVNDLRKRATVKLIPRIDLQALAAKFGGGATRKKMPAPAPRLISSNELEEFRPLIQYRLDRESGLRCEFLDGLMFKDGYLYKKVSIDSLSFWGIMPSEEELLKFKPSEKNENDDLEWLSDLYGKEKKRPIIKSEGGKGEGSSGSMGKRDGAPGSMGKGDGAAGSMGKGDSASGSMGKGDGASGSMGKGDGASGSKGKGDDESGSMGKGEASENGFLLYVLVCFGRKDFGLVIGMEKDDSYKILKEGPQGSVVVAVQKRELKNVLSDMKFTALDQRMKPICVSDTVKVLEGPLEGRQGIVKQIYRGTIFLYDENETENGGYFCSKSHMCEKIKLCIDDSKEKDGDSGAFVFEDFMSSPKSPLSPKKPWQERESNFNRGDTDAVFAIGQTVRIRVGPLKGYLCRVLAIRRSDITVKLDSQQKVLTVKCEHLTEVRGKSSNMLISEDPESSSLKPFDLLGTEGGSRDWTDGAGASAGADGWNPFSQDGNDVKKDDTSWESKVAPNKSSSWGDAAAAAAAADNNDQGAGWGKSVDGWDKSSTKSGGDSSASDIWQKAIEPAGTATAGKSELDSWGKGKTVVQAGSWEKNSGATTGDVASSGWGQQSSWDKGNAVSGDGPAWGKPHIKGAGGGAKEDPCSEAAGNWSSKEKTSLGDAGWKSSVPAADARTGSWGNAGGARAQPEAGNIDGASGWTQSKGGSSDENQKDSWKKPSSVVDDKRDSWVKEDGASTWNKQGGSSTRDKQDGDYAWNKSAGDSSWSKQTGGSSWGKQADVKSSGSGGKKGWGAEKENVESGDKQNNSWGSSQVARVEPSSRGNNGGKWNKGSATDEEQLTGGKKSGIWNAPKSSDKDQSSGWDQTTAWQAGSSDGGKNQDSNWGQKGNWNSGPSETDGNRDSNWGKKSDWNSQSSETGANQDSSWGKKTNWNSGSDGSCGNQDANWGKKSNWNTESNDTGGNKDSGWGKKNSWNSGSGDADQNSNWSSKSNCNSSSFGDSQERDGGNGDQTEDFNNNPSGGNWRGGSGRGNSDRGGFRGGRGFGGRGGDRGGFGGRDGDRGSFGGRGRSDRGGFSSRGGSDGGGFGGRRGGFGGGDGDRGSFGGRGRSDSGGFGGRGGSDGGFGGRGRGRRDQSGGWSHRNDSVDNNSAGWSKGADGSGEGWKKDNGGGSWSQGDGSKNNWQGGNSKGVGSFNSSDWSSQGSGWNKGTGSGFGGGTGDRPSAAVGGQSSDWKQSSAASGAKSSGWNQSGEAKQGTDEGTKPTNSWGKAAASSWGTGDGGSGKGGGTGNLPSAAVGGQSSGWKQSSAQSSDWNQSGEAKEGTDGGAEPANAWGKAAASSWGKGDGGSGKGGW